MIDNIEIRGKVDGSNFTEAYINARNEINTKGYIITEEFHLMASRYARGYATDEKYYVEWEYDAKVKRSD